MRHTSPVNTPRFLSFAAAFWALFGLITGIQVWIAMLDHGHNIPWLLSYYLVVWTAWWLPTLAVLRLARRYPVVPPTPRTIAVHAAAATLIALLHALYETGLMLWMRPFDRMTADLAQVNFIEVVISRLPLEWMLYCLVLGGVTAFEYYQRYHERALKAAQLERSLVDAKLHALELQLQPHFLFNTLNALTSLVRTQKKDQAISMIAGLADLLRYSLDHAGRQSVPLAEEISMLRRYLEIEQARFPDRMRFHIELPAAAEQAQVPTLILQPLAENAVRHGIAHSAEIGNVDVSVKPDGERLLIEMHNPGILPGQMREGIGLRNTRERLTTLYGADAEFSITQSGSSVVARLVLPYTRTE